LLKPLESQVTRELLSPIYSRFVPARSGCVRCSPISERQRHRWLEGPINLVPRRSVRPHLNKVAALPLAISSMALFERLLSARADRVALQASEIFVWGDFCQGGLSIFSSLRVSLFDLASRFFAPTHNRVEPARTEAVKDGARVSSATPQGPWSLTGSSTTARLLSSG